MRITELNIIEFGGIKNKRITFDNGLNIIFGANESGKSTVMLFIKFMLYGIARKTAKNFDRDRALSWSSRRASGSMTIEAGGKAYRIERRADTMPKNDYLNVICIETGEKIDGEPGEIFLGIGVDAYESSCSVAQMKATEISKSGAADAIENMLVSSDESIDVQKVLKSIDDMRREYKHNKGDGGKIHDARMEISRLKEKQRDTTEAYLSINEKSEALERNEARLKELDEECESSERLVRQIRSIEILQRFDMLENLQAEAKGTSLELQELSAKHSQNGRLPDENDVATLKNAYFSYKTAKDGHERRKSQYSSLTHISDEDSQLADIGEQVEQRGGVGAVISEARKYNKKVRTKTAISISTFVLAVICAVIGTVIPSLLIVLLCVSGSLAVIGTILLILSAKDKKQRNTLCNEYGKSFDALEAFLFECTEKLKSRRTSTSEIISARARLEQSEDNVSSARSRLISLLEKHAPVTDISDESLRALTDTHSRAMTDICEKRKELQAKLGLTESKIIDLQNELKGYDKNTLRASVTVDPATVTRESIEKTERKASYNKQARMEMQEKVRRLREEIIALKSKISMSPIELADRICKLKEQSEKDTFYYNALILAKEHIEGASASMSGNVTPQISRKAGELMNMISDGKHPTVQTNKELSLSVDQDGFLISADRLSGGTRDTAYICLRIALMQRLFEAELPPLILDETLCQLDDTRVKNILNIISSLCQSSQCLLFTCHTRELTICEESKIPYTKALL